MFAHVYHEGVGKKGANNVASLVVKTLKELNLLREDSVGGELNIIFDNCSGQNKNNTVLKLAMWLKAMGYFQRVNFIFLIVGHTKNAADRLFNSLKNEYRKKNLFTLGTLISALNVLESVTVIPTVPEDFFNYDKLFNDIYSKLGGGVVGGVIKKNHIFSCIDDDRIHIRESNLEKHKNFTCKVSKRGRLMNRTELKAYTSNNLESIESMGINPYKQVELWKNFREHIDRIYHDDILYQKPPANVLALVKEEKSTRSVFRAQIKELKTGGIKERLECVAYSSGGDGNDQPRTDDDGVKNGEEDRDGEDEAL